MLNFLRLKRVATDRKLRLFAVACCRHLFRQVRVDPHHLSAVDVAERHADGEATTAELIAPFPGSQNTSSARRTASIACRNATETEDLILMADCAAGNAVWAAGEHAASMANARNDSPVFIAAHTAEQVAQATFLRDILGPLPFRPLPSATTLIHVPASGKVVDLATEVYEQRAFTPARMGLVADALQEARCNNEEILSHCRNQTQIHVRGCWVIDLILGKH
jgi:hypothetical protein